MRGIFSFDLLFAMFILVSVLSTLSPGWDVYVDAMRGSLCPYLKDLSSAEAGLISVAGATASTVSFYEGNVYVELGGDVNVWGEVCR